LFVFDRLDGLTADELSDVARALAGRHLDRVERHATWPQHDLIDRGHLQAAHRL
jgi:hypothetical protein